MNKTVLCILSMFTGILIPLVAQELTPVKWSFGSDKISDYEYVLFFDASIEEGWHINSINQETKDEFLMPTEVIIDPNPAIELVPFLNEIGEAKDFRLSDSSKSISMFANKVTYNKILIKKSENQNITLSGTINYIACDVSRCLPPQRVPFQITLN